MTDKQDAHDDARRQSQRIECLAGGDGNLNERPAPEPAMPKVKNTPSSNPSTHERRKTGNKSVVVDDSWMTNDMPGINLPERIVFVVDTAREPDCTHFETRTGGKYSPLAMIKRVIEIFVSIKLGIHVKHEFALMTLESDSVSWVCDFTNNRKTFLSYLEKIDECHLDDDQSLFDLGPCFEKIFKNTDLDRPEHVATDVTRVVLVYARSRSIPQFLSGRRYFDELAKDSHFFVDSLYVHEPPGELNDCQEVYNKLGALETKRSSYVLECGKNPATLHTNMAKLTAHPLQRARQDGASYSVSNNPAATQEVQTNV